MSDQQTPDQAADRLETLTAILIAIVTTITAVLITNGSRHYDR